MHAAAMAPKFLNKTQVDQTWLTNETKILKEQTIAEGKPLPRIDHIVQGRVNKLLAEVCLEDQVYVKDPSKTISQYLAANNVKVTQYVRYEVGEGIEKKLTNFASEVAEQMRNK
jgi:elongation factor Ts